MCGEKFLEIFLKNIFLKKMMKFVFCIKNHAIFFKKK